jgi:hypothetical protein
MQHEDGVYMNVPRLVLLIINIIGGVGVIGSYILGLKTHTGGADVLWGGASQGIRPAYGVSMILSAVAYFAFAYFILFKLDPANTLIAGKLGYGFLTILFVLILGASALWMPLTYVYVGHSTASIWIGIRVVLLIVGISSCTLVWALFNVNNGTNGLAYWLAIAGSAYFAFHTTVLDALTWPVLFR